MERLLVDPRHRDVRILVDRAVEVREFGDWTMIYRDRLETADAFDRRVAALLVGVSEETAAHFRWFDGC